EHAEHAGARDTLARLLSAGDFIAIAPQVLAEFIHIVTDSRRFSQPLDMTAAKQLAEQWWTAREVVRVFPDDAATRQFLARLQQFSLGRKRLLDTLLAATYQQAAMLYPVMRFRNLPFSERRCCLKPPKTSTSWRMLVCRSSPCCIGR